MTRAGASHVPDDRIVDLVADLLDPSARASALEHLRDCAACERRFRETSGQRERLDLRRWRDAGTVADHAPAGRRRWQLLGAAAVLAVVGLFAGSELFRRGRADGLDYWLPLEGERLMLRSTPAPMEDGRYLAAVDA